MTRLIAGLILIVFNCAVILAQQTDKQSERPTTPVPVGVPASDPQPKVVTFQLSAPDFTFGQSQPTLIRSSDQSTKQVGPFVVMNGAVYMSLLGGQFLVPMSGGGASGCFSLDLPQRITTIKEFIPKIDSLDQGKRQRF
jgi:hypothetical protein